MKWPIIFALLTGLFWGTYGPVLGVARAAEGNAFKPYLMIGVAYLLWAVVGGCAGISISKSDFNFTATGTTWGFFAGSLGAFGALSLTLAMYSFPKGMAPRADIVMPIVFGTAVAISAITSLLMTKATPSPALIGGIIGMAVCIVVVASNTPHAAPHKSKPAGDAPAATLGEPSPGH